MGSDLKLFGIINMYNKRIKEHRDLWQIAKDNNITTVQYFNKKKPGIY